jgi:hypothetical protein
MLRVIKIILGILIALPGAVWLGQGLGFIKGSFMTGSAQWAIMGLAMLILAGWLEWSALRRRAVVQGR